MKKLIIALIIVIINLYSISCADNTTIFNFTTILEGSYAQKILDIRNNYYEANVYITAYSEGDDCYTGSIMASGEHVYEGAIAYNNVPLGTVVEINNKVYVVKDRVARDDTIDIYMESKDNALEFGRHTGIIKIRSD